MMHPLPLIGNWTLLRFIPFLNSSLFPHILHLDYNMFRLRSNLIGVAFLQALLGETYHNSPKTCMSDKQSILLQNFAGATYKLKNKGVGVPSSYLSNCIRPEVVALLSWPFASSKAVAADNSSKGTLQDSLALTTMEHTGLVQWSPAYQQSRSLSGQCQTLLFGTAFLKSLNQDIPFSSRFLIMRKAKSRTLLNTPHATAPLSTAACASTSSSDSQGSTRLSPASRKLCLVNVMESIAEFPKNPSVL